MSMDESCMDAKSLCSGAHITWHMRGERKAEKCTRANGANGPNELAAASPEPGRDPAGAAAVLGLRARVLVDAALRHA